MTAKFNIPDEFVQGFIKAGQSMMESFTKSYVAQIGGIGKIGVPVAPVTPPVPPSRL